MPQETCFGKLMLWDGFWGLKTSLGSLHFSLGMVTKFASRPHAWRLVSIGIGSFFCYSGSYSEQRPSRMCGYRAHNLLVLRSPQFSFTHRSQSLCEHSLCWRYACFSCTSEGSATSSQWKHWSGDCRVCQTCSASPVREKWMRKRNSTIKLFKVQSSSLGKKWGGLGRPSRSASDGHDFMSMKLGWESWHLVLSWTGGRSCLLQSFQ